MAFHYTTSVKKPDGIFHVRLYSFDSSHVFAAPAPHSGMPAHMQYLHEVTKEVPFPSTLIPAGGIGKLSEAYADQFFRATPEFQNFQLQLAAHPIFSELILEISGGAEVWLEIALEQLADDIPKAPAFTMFYPRKKRLYFWGRLLPQETKGHVKFQELNAASLADRSNFIAYQSARDHYGSLSMSFVHWFKIAAMQNPRAFLTSFVATHPGANATARRSEFLEAMVAWIQPTYFHAASDQRLLCKGNQPDNKNDPSRFNFLISADFAGSSAYNYSTRAMSGTIVGGVHDLYHIGFYVRNSLGNPWSLFNLDLNALLQPTGNNGPYSFYNFKTFGDLFLAFCEENQLKCQIELPTLEEAWSDPKMPNGLPENTNSREQHWEKCSRWLFFDAHTANLQFGGVQAIFPKNIYPVAEEDKIDYQPRPSWLGMFDAKDATAAAYTPPGTLNYPHEVQFGASADGAMDLSIVTLFCFADCGSGITDALTGTEVLLFDDVINVLIARTVTFRIATADTKMITFIQGAGDSYDQGILTTHIYCSWIGYSTARIWNIGSQIIQLDYFGIGLEPFGATADDKPVINDYRLSDFGEFPMFRAFKSNPGILLPAHTATDFRIFSIDRTPGEKTIGSTHIKALIQGTKIDQIPDVPPSDNPPTHPVITPPSFAEPVCGWINFIFSVLYSGDVCAVTATIDGAPAACTFGGRSGNLTNVFLFFAACAMAVGVHVVCITVVPCDTRVAPVTMCWNFTVNHNCC